MKHAKKKKRRRLRGNDFTVVAHNVVAILAVCILFVLTWMVAGSW